jgi:hypothetical protein
MKQNRYKIGGGTYMFNTAKDWASEISKISANTESVHEFKSLNSELCRAFIQEARLARDNGKTCYARSTLKNWKDYIDRSGFTSYIKWASHPYFFNWMLKSVLEDAEIQRDLEEGF